MFDGLLKSLSDFFGQSEDSTAYDHGRGDANIKDLFYVVGVPVLVGGSIKLYTMLRSWLSDAYANEAKRKDALLNVNRTLQLFDDDSIAKLKKQFPKSAAAARNVVVQLKAAKAELEKEPKAER